MNYKTPNLVSLMGNKAHSHQKKMMSHVYSKSSILSNSQLIESSTILIHDKLAPVLIDAARKRWDFDAYALNQAIGADFTSVFLLGMKNCTNFIGDLPAADEFRKMYKLKMKMLPGHENATKQLETLVLDLCRRASGANQDDLEGVVHAQLLAKLDNTGSSSGNSKGRDNLVIASEIFDHLIAGVETTRITLTYLEWELSRSASLQAQLRAELRTLSPPISLKASRSPSSALPTPKAIDSLPLLDAILKEILRLYPPSPALLPRVTPPGGAIINGFTIPAGTVIGSSSVCMHRNTSVFPEPDKFKPERWLLDNEKVREMNRWFWAFGSGGRMCIGSHFAIYCGYSGYLKTSGVTRVTAGNGADEILVLKLVVVAIYTDFETSIVDDDGIEQEDAFIAGPTGEKLVLRFSAAA